MVPAIPGLPGSDPTVLAAIGDAVRARLGADPRVQRIECGPLEIYAVNRFLSAAECAGAIALIDARARPSKLLAAANAPRIRTSHTCYLHDDEPLVAEIDARITGLIGQPQAHGETVQGQRYEPGQHFGVHNDYFDAGQPFSEAVEAEGGQRTWTAMAYLNRPASGGQTHFPFVRLAVPPTPGVLLVWNNIGRDGLPNPYSRHEGRAVEGGTKHVLTKWFREREWTISNEKRAERRG